MTDVNEMKCHIQEWFAEQWSIENVAKLYHEILTKCDKQLSHMISVLREEEPT